MSAKHFSIAAGLVAVLGLAAAGDASARSSYCCNDANGKLTCGDMLPVACHKRAYRILDERGRLVKEVEAPLTPEQRVLRDAETAKKVEEAKKAAEDKRHNEALLATYPSEKDIDVARDRALADFDKASADTQKRYDEATKEKKKLDAEKEFYVKKPMPTNLKRQVEDNEAAIKAAQAALDGRKQERDALLAKYGDEKKHYMELRYGNTPRTADTPAADKRPR
ncbi:hypothetical protein [Sulfurisoma sediminicola]|uniref:hypothetical protein n=1 Tax=Sulfurisoma sediminicola TaxID=1381557 RepID=UPI000F60D238|nr:hypothetical protein [Sulfurisoma sediminicola]